MILYHFTAARFIDRIKSEGITLGAVLVGMADGKPQIQTGLIWLTANPDFYAQTWNSRLTIKYDRAAYRITVEIPPSHQRRVLNWPLFCLGRVSRPIAQVLNSYGDPENWRLFEGVIPPEWFRAIDAKPTRGSERKQSEGRKVHYASGE